MIKTNNYLPVEFVPGYNEIISGEIGFANCLAIGGLAGLNRYCEAEKKDFDLQSFFSYAVGGRPQPQSVRTEITQDDSLRIMCDFVELGYFLFLEFAETSKKYCMPDYFKLSERMLSAFAEIYGSTEKNYVCEHFINVKRSDKNVKYLINRNKKGAWKEPKEKNINLSAIWTLLKMASLVDNSSSADKKIVRDFNKQFVVVDRDFEEKPDCKFFHIGIARKDPKAKVYDLFARVYDENELNKSNNEWRAVVYRGYLKQILGKNFHPKNHKICFFDEEAIDRSLSISEIETIRKAGQLLLNCPLILDINFQSICSSNISSLNAANASIFVDFGQGLTLDYQRKEKELYSEYNQWLVDQRYKIAYPMAKEIHLKFQDHERDAVVELCSSVVEHHFVHLLQRYELQEKIKYEKQQKQKH